MDNDGNLVDSQDGSLSSIMTTGGGASARSAKRSDDGDKVTASLGSISQKKPVIVTDLMNTTSLVRQNYYNLPKLKLKNLVKKDSLG